MGKAVKGKKVIFLKDGTIKKPKPNQFPIQFRLRVSEEAIERAHNVFDKLIKSGFRFSNGKLLKTKTESYRVIFMRGLEVLENEYK